MGALAVVAAFLADGSVAKLSLPAFVAEALQRPRAVTVHAAGQGLAIVTGVARVPDVAAAVEVTGEKRLKKWTALLHYLHWPGVSQKPVVLLQPSLQIARNVANPLDCY